MFTKIVIQNPDLNNDGFFAIPNSSNLPTESIQSSKNSLNQNIPSLIANKSQQRLIPKNQKRVILKDFVPCENQHTLGLKNVGLSAYTRLGQISLYFNRFLLKYTPSDPIFDGIFIPSSWFNNDTFFRFESTYTEEENFKPLLCDYYRTTFLLDNGSGNYFQYNDPNSTIWRIDQPVKLREILFVIGNQPAERQYDDENEYGTFVGMKITEIEPLDEE